MIYELTQIIYQTIAPTGRHNSILNQWVNMYIIAKINGKLTAINGESPSPEGAKQHSVG